jgi:hypothetical protein
MLVAALDQAGNFDARSTRRSRRRSAICGSSVRVQRGWCVLPCPRSGFGNGKHAQLALSVWLLLFCVLLCVLVEDLKLKLKHPASKVPVHLCDNIKAS